MSFQPLNNSDKRTEIANFGDTQMVEHYHFMDYNICVDSKEYWLQLAYKDFFPGFYSGSRIVVCSQSALWPVLSAFL